MAQSECLGLGEDQQATHGLTAEAIAWAYRFFLDREPESVAIVEAHIKNHKSLASFRSTMLKAAEFRAKLADSPAMSGSKPLDWPPIRVDVEVAPEQLSRMIALVEGNWAALGRTEPHWSVLTGEEFKSENIKNNEHAFYQGGQASFDLMVAAATRCGIDISCLDTCLELGCGVGRVTIWLAQQFRSVIAADVSQPHISIAESALRSRHLENVSFRHVNSLESLRNLPTFDAFYSFIVLQHNPPPVILFILDLLFAKLNPGGVAYFQLPTYWMNYGFNAAAYLANAEIRGAMEMHVLPQQVVFSLAARHRCQVLEVREDSCTGWPYSVSNSFLLQKQR